MKNHMCAGNEKPQVQETIHAGSMAGRWLERLAEDDGWLAGWLAGCWLAGVAGSLAGWLAGWLVGWLRLLAGWLDGWLTGQPVEKI